MTLKRRALVCLFLFLTMICEEIIASLQKMSNPEYAAGAEHFGIKTISLNPKDPLAIQELWQSVQLFSRLLHNIFITSLTTMV